jgi:uncharacterized protein with ParB-like and HNH nuclease domain
MKADDISVEDFLSANKTRFIIPVYQRNYDWKEKNCQQLLDDIIGLMDSNRKSHFLGSIVYVTNSDTDSIDLREYVIIDGQQRLTTATLFLKALHDSSDDEDLKEEILENFLINKRLSDKNKLKLKPIKKDDEVFQKLLKNDFDNININSNIYRNYLFLKNKMDNFANHKGLFNGFKKLFVVHIALNRRDDNPQLIFESINSTGVSLSQADLIRNFLLMDKEANKQNELFEMFWLKIEENLTSENISMFVRDYLTMKQNKIPNKDDTYETFKHYVNEAKVSTDELLAELLNFSKIYKTFLFDSEEVYSIYLKNLRQLKMSTVYPFLMTIIQNYNEGRIAQKELLNTLDIIESYVVRRMVCNKPTNALNKIFASLFVEIQNSENFSYEKFNNYFVSILLSKKGSGVFPNDEEFRGEFCARDAYNLKNIKFILLRLENKDHNEKVDGTILSIEHVMPQTLSTAWKVKLGDKYQLVHDKYLHNIGNLSLSGDNTQLSNNSFEEKKQILNSQSSLRLNRYFLDLSSWDEEEMIKRSLSLFEDAKVIWNYPKDLVLQIKIEDEDKEFYTLDDEVDVTGKKPLYFEFSGEKVKVGSWSELFLKVIEKLYEFDENIAKSLLFDDDFSGKKQRILSSIEENIRKPFQLKEGFFIETNLSAKSILNYTKLICEKFGLSGDDFVYAIL